MLRRWIPAVVVFVGILNIIFLPAVVDNLKNVPDSDYSASFLLNADVPYELKVGSILEKLDMSRSSKATTIAYVISLTDCPEDHRSAILDGAAILRHSIHKQSKRTIASHSNYDYHMYAIIHPSALHCSKLLHDVLNYTLLVRDTPVNVSDIRGTYLREHIHLRGCCGVKELIKLYAYTLTDYPAVVHLDMDTILLQPLDELYNAMLYPYDDHTPPPSWSSPLDPTLFTTYKTASTEVEGQVSSLSQSRNNSKIHIMFPNTALPAIIDAYFTRDYPLAEANKKYVNIQGGFFVVRPSMNAFYEYVNIVKEGDFNHGNGWKGQYGGGYGAMTVQGVMSYYYDGLFPNTSVELDNCIYDNMVQSPHYQQSSVCHGRKEQCEDCRKIDSARIKLFHFTFCPKPWTCRSPDSETNNCAKMTKQWFQLRKDMEETFWKKRRPELYTNVSLDGLYRFSQYQGYCRAQGGKGYLPIPFNMTNSSAA